MCLRRGLLISGTVSESLQPLINFRPAASLGLRKLCEEWSHEKARQLVSLGLCCWDVGGVTLRSSHIEWQAGARNTSRGSKLGQVALRRCWLPAAGVSSLHLPPNPCHRGEAAPGARL